MELGAVLAAGALDLLSLDEEADLLSFAALPESDLESALASDLESESLPEEPLSDELLLGA
ncbi:MAG: hypothetical protein WA802_17315 [Terracidiphilus sp.]